MYSFTRAWRRARSCSDIIGSEESGLEEVSWGVVGGVLSSGVLDWLRPSGSEMA